MMVTTYHRSPCPAICWVRLTVGLTLASSGIIPVIHTDHCRRKGMLLTVLVYRLTSAALDQRGWYLVESRFLSQGTGRKLMSLCRVLCCAHFRRRELLLWVPTKPAWGNLRPQLAMLILMSSP